MVKKLAPLAAVVALVAFPLLAQDPETPSAPVAEPPVLEPDEIPEASRVLGTITQVALYQGTALISRQIEVPAGQEGPVELIVSELPTATDPATVYADGTVGVDVRSVACRKRALTEEEKAEDAVAALDLAIRELERKMSDNRNEMALRRIRQEYLRALERFVAPAATQEMTHGVLQAKELEAVTKMHFAEYEAASQEI